MIDVTTEGKWFLSHKINKLVRDADEVPDKLIITMEQYEVLHKHIEVFYGNDKVPVEYLYHGKNNIMEVEVK